MFNRVGAVVLFVRDFDQSLAFYRDVLELPVVQLESNFAAFKLHDQDFALQELSAAVEMFGVKADGGMTGSGSERAMLCAKVDDVDAVYATLKSKGVAFAKPPVDQYWGIRAIYFHDPEGNFWEFSQPQG
ncbi:MAG: VOC family protein [Anaerolinea sp.]|nr:VOC family protein [Anaerolinea sp.]